MLIDVSMVIRIRATDEGHAGLFTNSEEDLSQSVREAARNRPSANGSVPWTERRSLHGAD